MNDARQQMLERIGEDESLTGDLAGDAAEQLRQWANDTAYAIAQRDDLDDATVQQYIKAVRIAARKSAAHDGDLTVAQRELATAIDATLPAVVAPNPVSSTPAPQLTPDTIPTPATTTETASAYQPMWLRVRGWWRGMWSRAPKEE
ncbi:MAG: hypothetical protein ACK5GU_01980 [Chloroflexota bacterium]|jgi:hypothetical protein